MQESYDELPDLSEVCGKIYQRVSPYEYAIMVMS